MRTFSLFISHSWAYGDAYDRLVDLLRARPYFAYVDHSVPRDNPIHNAVNDSMLYDAITRQMAPCDVVIVLAGVYATYSRWINKEVAIARQGFRHPKPILAVAPWGAERTSAFVRANADDLVRWNTESVVAGIRRLAG